MNSFDFESLHQDLLNFQNEKSLYNFSDSEVSTPVKEKSKVDGSPGKKRSPRGRGRGRGRGYSSKSPGRPRGRPKSKALQQYYANGRGSSYKSKLSISELNKEIDDEDAYDLFGLERSTENNLTCAKRNKVNGSSKNGSLGSLTPCFDRNEDVSPGVNGLKRSTEDNSANNQKNKVCRLSRNGISSSLTSSSQSSCGLFEENDLGVNYHDEDSQSVCSNNAIVPYQREEYTRTRKELKFQKFYEKQLLHNQAMIRNGFLSMYSTENQTPPSSLVPLRKVKDVSTQTEKPHCSCQHCRFVWACKPEASEKGLMDIFQRLKTTPDTSKSFVKIDNSLCTQSSEMCKIPEFESLPSLSYSVNSTSSVHFLNANCPFPPLSPSFKVSEIYDTALESTSSSLSESPDNLTSASYVVEKTITDDCIFVYEDQGFQNYEFNDFLDSIMSSTEVNQNSKTLQSKSVREYCKQMQYIVSNFQLPCIQSDNLCIKYEFPDDFENEPFGDILKDYVDSVLEEMQNLQNFSDTIKRQNFCQFFCSCMPSREKKILSMICKKLPAKMNISDIIWLLSCVGTLVIADEFYNVCKKNDVYTGN